MSAPENSQPTEPQAPEPQLTEPQAPSIPEAAPARPKRPLWLKIVGVVAAVAVAIGAWIATTAILNALSGPPKQQVIEAAVEQALAQFDPPQQLDEVTIITDVKAEPDAIHYFYELVDVDPSLVDAEVLEGIVGPGLCGSAETRNVLDQDVAMRYTYVVRDTGDSYDVEFRKGYC